MYLYKRTKGEGSRYTTSHYIATFEARREAEDEASRKRRVRLELKAARSMFECLARLKEDPSAFKAYASIQRALSAATKCWFDDFQYLDVELIRGRAMEGMERVSLDAGSASANSLDTVADNEVGKKTNGNKDRSNEKIGENLALQETATVARNMNKAELDEDVYKLDLPPPTDKDRAAAADWNKMINGIEFQASGLAPAMMRCYMSDADLKRIPYQAKDKTLRWWQVIYVWWAIQVREFANTKGGLDADTVGLGKTLSYGAQMLVVGHCQ